MSCGQVVHDYVLGLCYVVPCDLLEVSLNYFDRLAMIGLG